MWHKQLFYYSKKKLAALPSIGPDPDTNSSHTATTATKFCCILRDIKQRYCNWKFPASEPRCFTEQKADISPSCICEIAGTSHGAMPTHSECSYSCGLTLAAGMCLEEWAEGNLLLAQMLVAGIQLQHDPCIPLWILGPATCVTEAQALWLLVLQCLD